MQGSVRVTGAACLAAAAACIAPAALFHCAGPALRIGAPSLAAGAVLGLCMALITRARNATLIYLLVAACFCTAAPILRAWPPLRMMDLLEYDGPASRVETYLEALRPMLYIIGFPFPYACLGWHAPDAVAGAGAQNADPENDER